MSPVTDDQAKALGVLKARTGDLAGVGVEGAQPIELIPAGTGTRQTPNATDSTMRHDDDSSLSLAAGTPYVDATAPLASGAGAGGDDFLGATIGQCCDMRSSAWSEN